MFDVKLDPLRRRLIISHHVGSQGEADALIAKMRKRDMAHQVVYKPTGKEIVITIPTTKFISAVDTFSTEQKAGV